MRMILVGDSLPVRLDTLGPEIIFGAENGQAVMKINPNTWQFPEYETFFGHGAAANYGRRAWNEINTNIKGRVAMTQEDAATLAQAVFMGGGVYLEFGSLFGGSAILAAMVMREFNLPSYVVCVDDSEMTGDDTIILDNAIIMGVNEKIFINHGKIKDASIDQKPGVTLVDAGHDYGNCLHDISIAEKITRKYILVHDYDPSHMDVVKAANMSTWIPVFIYGHMLVLKKVDEI